MAVLDRSAILKAAGGFKLKTIDVHIAELGGTVRLQELTGAEMSEWQSTVALQKLENRKIKLKNRDAQLICLCVIDESGQKVFGIDDAPALGEWGASVVKHLFDECAKLNGLTKEEADELEKN